jgi:hypothetical protein
LLDSSCAIQKDTLDLKIHGEVRGLGPHTPSHYAVIAAAEVRYACSIGQQAGWQVQGIPGAMAMRFNCATLKAIRQANLDTQPLIA